MKYLLVAALLFTTPWVSTAHAQTPLNVSRGKIATQSNTDFGGVAARAVDGNTDGNWGAGSVTHTQYSTAAWWRVDLGAVFTLAHIDIWNRTDCCADRLRDLEVVLRDGRGDVVKTIALGGPHSAQKIHITESMGVRARYVEVVNQPLPGENAVYLSLAEVQVFATPEALTLPNQALTGFWRDSPARSSLDNPKFKLSIKQAGIARIDLTSDVDTYLTIVDANGATVATNDDVAWPSNSNSRIQQYFAAGEYTAIASTFSPGQRATFNLSTDRGTVRFRHHVQVATEDLIVSAGYFAETLQSGPLSLSYPYLAPNYYSLGDMALASSQKPSAGLRVRQDGDLLAPPVDYEWVWDNSGLPGDRMSIWRALPPTGYTCLGNITIHTLEKPDTDWMRCIRSEYVLPANGLYIWDSFTTGGDHPVILVRPTVADPRGMVLDTFVATNTAAAASHGLCDVTQATCLALWDTVIRPQLPELALEAVAPELWTLNRTAVAGRDLQQTQDWFAGLGYSWTVGDTLQQNKQCTLMDSSIEDGTYNLALAACRVGDTVVFTPLYLECNTYDSPLDGLGNCELGTIKTEVHLVDGNGVAHTLSAQGPTISACGTVDGEFCAGATADLVSAAWQVGDETGNSFTIGAGVGVGAAAHGDFEDGVLSAGVNIGWAQLGFSFDTHEVSYFFTESIPAAASWMNDNLFSPIAGGVGAGVGWTVGAVVTVANGVADFVDSAGNGISTVVDDTGTFITSTGEDLGDIICSLWCPW